MTPAARIAAAAELLDEILQGRPAEPALLNWSRASRFAGSGDRAAVRDLVFEALRRRGSLAALGGALSGRGLMIGLLRETGQDPDMIFTGEGYAPAPLTDDERRAGGEGGSDIPEWVLPLWREALGQDAEIVAESMRRRAPVWLRVNLLKSTRDQAIKSLSSDEIEVSPAQLLDSALRVTGGERRIRNSRAYREGWVELQDLSPQMACAALPVKNGDRVLDYCAGGGGKILAVSGRASGLELVAHDADASRMADLDARAQRAGVKLRKEARPPGKFQLVIADVPCSGSGTWRRTPDAKWRFSPEDLDRLTKLQARIMNEAAAFVAPGGCLAYMTCSFLRPENGTSVDDFVSKNSVFSEISRKLWTPVSASDGFFCSLLKRGS